MQIYQDYLCARECNPGEPTIMKDTGNGSVEMLRKIKL
jgi:hypothetical protein